MLSLKHDHHFKKCFSRFMKKQGRVNFQLKEMVQLLKINVNFELFKIILQQTTNITCLLKILMLINRYLIEVKQNQGDIFQIINHLKWKYRNQFQQLLFKKLVQPYRLYLQKRSISGLNNNQFGSNNHTKETKTYQLLNLLCLGTSFTDILYIFGRYYLNKMSCIIDFNITLGVDLQFVYKAMVQHITRPAPKIILEQLEIIHQKLYVVFYNCYFHKYLKNYVPKWVITDVNFESPRKSSANISTRSNSNNKQKTFVRFQKSKSVSRFSQKSKKQKMQNMGESFVFLNEGIDQIAENIENEQQHDKVMQGIKKKQEGLKLLQSMERYIQQLRSIQ